VAWVWGSTLRRPTCWGCDSIADPAVAGFGILKVAGGPGDRAVTIPDSNAPRLDQGLLAFWTHAGPHGRGHLG
jgi:hypothetical protein